MVDKLDPNYICQNSRNVNKVCQTGIKYMKASMMKPFHLFCVVVVILGCWQYILYIIRLQYYEHEMPPEGSYDSVLFPPHLYSLNVSCRGRVTSTRFKYR